MRRYGLAFLGIAMALMLGCIYLMAQRISDAEQGLLLLQKFSGHEYAVYAADFDENEELIASGGVDGLRVWRVDNAKEVFHRPGDFYQARFVKGGDLLAAGHEEGILLLDCETWRVRRKLGPKRNNALAEVSLNGDRIAATFASADKNTRDSPFLTEIYVWHMVDGEWQELILHGHSGPIYWLVFLPSSPHLISHGEKGVIRVWNLSTGKQIDERGEKLAIDGHQVPQAMTSSALTRLLGVKYAHDYALGHHTILHNATKVNDDPKLSPAYTASYSPNSKWIATGHKDGTLHLWDAKTLTERAVVKGSINGSPLTEARFSRSGKLLVTAGDGWVAGFTALQKKVKADDTVVRVWRVNVDPE